jgi:hypothetical protein
MIDMSEANEGCKTEYFLDSQENGLKHAIVSSDNFVFSIAPVGPLGKDHLSVLLFEKKDDDRKIPVGEPVELFDEPANGAEKIAEVIEGKIREGEEPNEIFEAMRKVDITKRKKNALSW